VGTHNYFQNLKKSIQRKDTMLHKAFNPQDSNTLHQRSTVTSHRFTVTQERCQCRTPRASNHATLCPRHAAAQHDDSADLSAFLNQDLPKQKSAADIHTHLWNLSLALQQGRISPRRAAVLAYINSLLLRTLPAIDKQEDSIPQKIIIDIPGAIRRFPEDDDSFRSGESLDSHFTSAPPPAATPPPPASILYGFHPP
jgi:hypothetical protein